MIDSIRERRGESGAYVNHSPPNNMKLTFRPLSYVLASTLTCLSLAAHALTPQTGFWWTPNESGSGYTVEVQDNLLFMAFYSYDKSGKPVWYVTSGPLANSGATYSGPLFRVDSGPCLGCAYTPPGTSVSQGTVRISFVSGAQASIVFPDGSSKAIRAFDFGIGRGTPGAYRGAWIAYWVSNGSVQTRLFEISQAGNATSSGNGAVAGASNTGTVFILEYQTTGVLSGYTIGVEASSTGSALNSFLLDVSRNQLEGLWVNTTTGATAPFEAFRAISRSGLVNRLHDTFPVPKRLDVPGASAPGHDVTPPAESIDASKRSLAEVRSYLESEQGRAHFQAIIGQTLTAAQQR